MQKLLERGRSALKQIKVKVAENPQESKEISKTLGVDGYEKDCPLNPKVQFTLYGHVVYPTKSVDGFWNGIATILHPKLNSCS